MNNQELIAEIVALRKLLEQVELAVYFDAGALFNFSGKQAITNSYNAIIAFLDSIPAPAPPNV